MSPRVLLRTTNAHLHSEMGWSKLMGWVGQMGQTEEGGVWKATLGLSGGIVSSKCLGAH